MKIRLVKCDACQGLGFKDYGSRVSYIRGRAAGGYKERCTRCLGKGKLPKGDRSNG